MKILVTNHWLKKLGGSETFTYTLIAELVRQGHQVDYFTFIKGIVSNRIEKDLGVRFSEEGIYDLILASHYTTVNHCVRNMYGPIIQTCHGTIPKLEQPCEHADAFVAVSREVEVYLHNKRIDINRVKHIFNGIDLKRFISKSEAVSPPRFVLSLSHSDKLNFFLSDYFKSKKMQFSALNKYSNPIWEVEKHINLADLVVSAGRGAMEAMACDRPVIVMDDRPYMDALADGLVTRTNFHDISYCNFSGRALKKNPYDKNFLEEELTKIDIYLSDQVFHLAKEHFDVRNQVKKYIDYYECLRN